MKYIERQKTNEGGMNIKLVRNILSHYDNSEQYKIKKIRKNISVR